MKERGKILHFIFKSIIDADKIIPIIYIPVAGVIAMLLTMIRVKNDYKKKKISNKEYNKSIKNLTKGLLLTFILTLIFMALLKSILKYLNLMD